MRKKLIAIVPAAGVGMRATQARPPHFSGADHQAEHVDLRPKQYRNIAGKPMLRWSVLALLADERVSQVRVAVAPGDSHAEQALEGLPRTVCRPCGGATRADTVRQALIDAALTEDDWVLVHDAARPGLGRGELRRLIDECWQQQQGGLLAVPVADTIKRARQEGQRAVDGSVDRSSLWLAQTPQCFPGLRLLTALQLADDDKAAVTDEASAMERMGDHPLLIQGSPRNFKVTWPEDFELMGLYLASGARQTGQAE